MYKKIILIIFLTIIVFGLAFASIGTNTAHLQLLREHSTKELVDLGLSCNNPDSAMIYYSLAIKRYSESPKKEDMRHYIRALNGAGYTSLFFYRDFSRGCYYLMDAEQIARESGDSAMLALITLNLANLYVGTDQSREAIKLFRHSMRLSLEEKDTLCYVTAYVGLLPQLVVENALDEAIEDLKGFSCIERSDVHMTKFAQKLTVGLLLQKDSKYEEALKYFKEAEDYIDTPFTPERYKITPIIMQSNTYKNMGRYDEAIDCALKAIPILNNEGRIDIYQWISDLYKEIGDTINYERYRLLYLDNAYDVGLLNQRLSDMVSAKTSFERNLFLHNIERLESENHIKKTVLFLSLIWGGIITFLLLWLWFAYRKLKLSKENLFLKNQTIVESKSQVIKKLPEHTPDNIDEEKRTLQDLSNKICELVSHTTEPFNNDFSINRLAYLLNEHPRKISKAINECLEKNFNSWLAEIRIEEACRRLADFDNYGSYSIAGIAEGVGFKSRTHFAEVFKRHTGLSPSEYQRLARKNI